MATDDVKTDLEGLGGYLSGPRIHFAGQFQTNVSTVNNDANNYKGAADQKENPANWANFYNQNKGAMSWNAWGTGSFTFENCTVRGVVGGTGQPTDAEHAMVGNPITLVGQGGSDWGRMVDLDVSAQDRSAIWGASIQIQYGPNDDDTITGVYDVASFQDAWPATQDAQFFIHAAAIRAVYQSTIQVELTNEFMGGLGATNEFLFSMLDSTYSVELPDTDSRLYTLSIKFVVDNYKYDPFFHAGNMTGVISTIASQFVPKTFLIGRHLMPVPPAQGPPTFGYVKAVVTDEFLTVDYSNALLKIRPDVPANSFQPYADVGPITLKLVGDDSPGFPLNNYTDENFMLVESSIVSYAIDADIAQRLRQGQMVVVVGDDETESSKESDNGIYAQVDRLWSRIECGNTDRWGQDSFTVYAMQFGVPLDGSVYHVNVNDAGLRLDDGNGTGTDIVLDYPKEDAPPITIDNQLVGINGPNSSGTFTIIPPDTLVVNGTAPRQTYGLDSLVYFLAYDVVNTESGTVEFSANSDSGLTIEVLVFGQFTIPDNPNWTEHVQPALHMFYYMYPVMQRRFNLQSYEQVKDKKGAMEARMALDEANYYSERYMPVTRDLAFSKAQMILNWCQNDCPEGPE